MGTAGFAGMCMGELHGELQGCAGIAGFAGVAGCGGVAGFGGVAGLAGMPEKLHS